jgi:hypothetical protein
MSVRAIIVSTKENTMTQPKKSYPFDCLSIETVNKMIAEGVDPRIILEGTDPDGLMSALVLAQMAEEA